MDPINARVMKRPSKKASSSRLTKLPRGTDAQIGVRVVAGIVVDVETVRIEVANVDEVAVGRLNLCVLFLPHHRIISTRKYLLNFT